MIIYSYSQGDLEYTATFPNPSSGWTAFHIHVSVKECIEAWDWIKILNFQNMAVTIQSDYELIKYNTVVFNLTSFSLGKTIRSLTS